ncbi:MAG: hypothetical protein JNK05_29815 [Myxococcales bacterium]|nr:hypothetical protein [Myxococcales bacterium]
MNTRSAPDVASPFAPPLEATDASLATVSSRVEPPSTLALREARSGDTFVLEVARSTSAFRRKAASTSVIMLVCALFGCWLVRLALDVPRIEPGPNLVALTILALAVGGPLAIMLAKSVASTLDGTRIQLSATELRFSSGIIDAIEPGESTFDVRTIFAIGVQSAATGTRIVVLDRDGEVRAVRCNLHEPLHVAYVVAKLNEELTRLRAQSHYRS